MKNINNSPLSRSQSTSMLTMMVRIVKVLIILFAIIFSNTQAEKRKKCENNNFQSPCGTSLEVATRVAKCLAPIIDTLYGRLPTPQTENDLISFCNRFNGVEPCVKKIATECTEGIHRTAVTAVGSALKKYRSNRCKTVESRAPFLPTWKCIDKNYPIMPKIFDRNAALVQGLRNLDIDPAKRLVNVCCILENINKDIESKLRPLCPHDYQIAQEMFNSVSGDFSNLLCTRPRCDGVIGSVSNHKLIANQTIIEPIIEIVLLI